MLQKQEQKCQHYKLKRTILHSNSFSAHPLRKESVYERLHSVSDDQVPGQIALIFAQCASKFWTRRPKSLVQSLLTRALKDSKWPIT